MAYTIDDDSIPEIKEIHNRLLDDLLAGDTQFYLKECHLDTKEKVLKDGVLKKLNDFIKELNAHFLDKNVYFDYQWIKGLSRNNDMSLYSGNVSNKELTEDDLNFENDWYFYETPINQIDIQLNYHWIRWCNLGCKHITKRFYITNMARLLDILAYWKAKMPVRDIIDMFLPDFFDFNALPANGSRKRGRPRRASKAQPGVA